MSGTVSGGKKAAKTNKERQGDDFYVRIGRKGGSQVTPGKKKSGFASMTPERRKACGKKGGAVSRRGAAKVKTTSAAKKPAPKYKTAKPVINPEPKPGIFKRIFGAAK